MNTPTRFAAILFASCTIGATAHTQAVTPPRIVGDSAILIGGKTVLGDHPCGGVTSLQPSPNRQWYLIVMRCIEEINDAYVMSYRGDYLTRITGEPAGLGFVSGRNARWLSGSSIVEYVGDCGLGDEPLPECGLRIRIELPERVPPLTPGRMSLRSYFRVNGVAIGDSLNIRTAPSAESRIVGSIPPCGRGIEERNISRMSTGNSTWIPIRWANYSGWVNGRFLIATLDVRSDATARPCINLPTR